MNDSENNNAKDYNSIVTVILIISLIIVRISIFDNQKQNVIIAWINFISIFYVLWRIYYQINNFLKIRTGKITLFKEQHRKFKNCSIFLLCILIFIMIIYSMALYFNESFYLIGNCINDILSLFALLFSIEDERIIDYLQEHYRYK